MAKRPALLPVVFLVLVAPFGWVVRWSRVGSDHHIKGLIVEKGSAGFTASTIENKIAVRIVQNADLTLDNVCVPAENWLPGTASFRDTNKLLENSRVWVAWQSVGHQLAPAHH